MAIFQFQKNSLVIFPFCLYRFGYCTYDFIVICVEWYKNMQAVFICTCLYYNVFRPFSNVTMKSEKNMPKIFEYNYCLIFKKVYKKKPNTKKYFITNSLHQSIPSVNFIYVQVSLLKRQRDLNLPNLRIITQTTPIFKSSRSPFIVSSLYI
mgnify:CR=1 FL=1